VDQLTFPEILFRFLHQLSGGFEQGPKRPVSKPLNACPDRRRMSRSGSSALLHRIGLRTLGWSFFPDWPSACGARQIVGTLTSIGRAPLTPLAQQIENHCTTSIKPSRRRHLAQSKHASLKPAEPRPANYP